MKKILFIFIFPCIPTPLQATDRVLEISGDGKKITASVVFLNASGATDTSIPQVTRQRFDWVAIPEGAVQYQIKVGEIASKAMSLETEKNTFAKVGDVKYAFNSSGVAQLYLDVASQPEQRANVGAEGFVFLGQLNGEGEAAQQSWKSLYVVRAEDKKKPDADNPGTYTDVVTTLLNKSVLADFPLYLRLWSATDGRPTKSPNDKVVRPGQKMNILEIKNPTPDGMVYARVKIES